MPLLVVSVALVGAIVALRVLGWLTTRRAERAWPPGGRFLEVDGVRLHVVDRGAGPTTVVLLHGSSGFAQDWTLTVADRLAERYRVLAFDRAGSGHSGRPREPLTPAVHLRLVLGALDRLGVDRAVWVGHSYSGTVVLRVAVEHPGRVAGVVHVAGVAFGNDPGPLRLPFRLRALSAVYAATFPLLRPLGRRYLLGTLVPAFAPEPIDPTYLAAASSLWTRPSQLHATVEDQVFTGAGLGEAAARYGAIAAPLAVVTSDGDRHVDRERHALPLHAAVPGSRLFDVPGVGHDIPHIRPDAVLAAIAWADPNRHARDAGAP